VEANLKARCESPLYKNEHCPVAIAALKINKCLMHTLRFIHVAIVFITPNFSMIKEYFFSPIRNK
jgi:hypothetical protein